MLWKKLLLQIRKNFENFERTNPINLFWRIKKSIVCGHLENLKYSVVHTHARAKKFNHLRIRTNVEYISERILTDAPPRLFRFRSHTAVRRTACGHIRQR